MNSWKQLKINVKLLIRFTNDLWSKRCFQFSKKTNNNNVNFDYSISLSQEIKKGISFENKLHNLEIASGKINEYSMKPNEIFSFFKIVGNPEYDFKKSRTLVNGKLTEQNGGGLCQVSGIIYHISLIAGLEIVERHNHSVDIYTDETRFTPLGTDATIVYGYKDLRVKNNLPFSIKFEMEIKDNFIQVNLRSEKRIEEKQLFFESKMDQKNVIVNLLNSDRKLLNQSRYIKVV